MKELKDELARLSEDYSALTSAKSQLEGQVADSDERFADLEAKVAQLETDKSGMRLTIKELEKRRDQAIKEIRSLKH